MDLHPCDLIREQTVQSVLFLYFGVLTFTLTTTLNKQRVRVSKSRNP
jgi:hypothetical protein